MLTIEEFLKEENIQELLNENDLDSVYLTWPGKGNDLTDFLLYCDIEPLNYVNIIHNRMYLGWDFEEFEIPKHITRIADLAFSYCKHLRVITIPDTVVSIRPRAFEGCLNHLIIRCVENSTAHEYAIDNNIKFELLE